MVENECVVYLNPATTVGKVRYKLTGEIMNELLGLKACDLICDSPTDEKGRIVRIQKENKMLITVVERLCKSLRLKYAACCQNIQTVARSLHAQYLEYDIADRPIILVDAKDALLNPLTNEHRTFDPFGPFSGYSLRQHETYRGNLSSSDIDMQIELRKTWAKKVALSTDEATERSLKIQLSRLYGFWTSNHTLFPSFYIVVFDSRNTKMVTLPPCSNCVYLDICGLMWSYTNDMRRVVSKTPQSQSGVIYYKAYVPSYTKDFTLPNGRTGTIVDFPGPASFYDFCKVKQTPKKRSEDTPNHKREIKAVLKSCPRPWYINSTGFTDDTDDVVPLRPEPVRDLYLRDVALLLRPIHYSDFRLDVVDSIPKDHLSSPPKVYKHPWTEAPPIVTSIVDDKIRVFPPSTKDMDDRGKIVLPPRRKYVTIAAKESFRRKTYEEMDSSAGEYWHPDGHVKTAKGKVSLVSDATIVHQTVQILSGPPVPIF